MGEARPSSKVTELISPAPPRAEFPAIMPKLTAGLAEHHQHPNCKYSQSAPPRAAADSICVVSKYLGFINETVLSREQFSTACSYRAKNSSPEKNQAGRFRSSGNRRRNGVIGNGHRNTVEELMGADAKHIKTRKIAALKVVNVRNSIDL